MTITNPKLSDRIRPDVEAAPWVIAEIEKLEQQLAAKQAEIAAGRASRDAEVAGLYQQVTLLRDALKQARHMIYYGEPQIGWNITRIDEVIDATKEQ